VQTQHLVKRNLYKDSVTLMYMSERLAAMAGVRHATLLMGTPANKDILRQAGLSDSAFDDVQPCDIMVAIGGDSVQSVQAAAAELETLLSGHANAKARGAESNQPILHSLAMGVAAAERPVNLAQISVPGQYAGAEALKALKLGLHVFLFSDNVPLDQEVFIKRLARQKGLLVMGPDCGTAIIQGVPLGFANVVRAGRVGLVGASGTGLQQISCQIHALGGGISHVLGTGSRDLQDEVGGITMLQALELLGKDPKTETIVIVSKPPSATVAGKVLDKAISIGKPTVVLFLGLESGSEARVRSPKVTFASNLSEAAMAAASGPSARTAWTAPDDLSKPFALELGRRAAGQRYIRGLYSGGTFCTEALLIWRAQGIGAHSNVRLTGVEPLPDVARSREHTALDLGSDEFTVGRPHPMIDYSVRTERLLQEAEDPQTALIVMDVVLGYGSHHDPAGVLAPAIAEARRRAQRAGRHLAVVTFVCGTDEDPQGLTAQKERLAQAGAFILPTSTDAAALAAAALGAPRA
jgi:FdrA protein